MYLLIFSELSSAPVVVQRMEIQRDPTNGQMGVLPKKDNERSENKMISLEPKPIAWGFHHLKQLSGLSYICNLAKYDFNFKQYLLCIYQRQI